MTLGAGAPKSEGVRRARKLGGITATRILFNKGSGRSTAVSASTYATYADATESLSSFLGNQIRMPFMKLTILESKLVSDRQFPALANALIYEESSIGSRGPQGWRIVAGAVGNIRLGIIFSAIGDLWSWDEIEECLTRQVAKFRDGIDELPRTGLFAFESTAE
jgi:hypothetical protein